MTHQTTVPPGLRTDAPPHDPRQQILAWGIDLNALGFGQPHPEPRWMVVQWVRMSQFGGAYWAWSVPGRQTGVEILGWQPLPRLDYAGEAAARLTERAEMEAACHD
jgi:hypothetical protein